ncbi:hypothetical protein [Lentzea aerocolonigenes]|uniref:hypothetical protein n=1 Tax=Lentzea aerocolonigenes TaxID=68170 RepID=UPI000AF45148|nr:hypothetical protein [Lentzea aerocolonigenes]MCP2245775.1 hypothetical protein [Lentzea aerocolonigenes]
MPTNEFGPDGTQAPPPPRPFPDPLAGLVTADTWIAPQWTSSTSRVSVPTPPEPTEEMRQAIFAQMERERRRPRGRVQRPPHQQPQPFAPTYQIPVAQQQQAARQTGGVGAFIGCLVVLAFFVLVVINILASIFS